jgi:hypothetical protein
MLGTMRVKIKITNKKSMMGFLNIELPKITHKKNKRKYQNSEREALPLKVAYFVKHVEIA